ncbi:MAG: hypothetical protein LBL20_04400, partial [Treponema sp.]|jgi:hypothetical protein|nr:hypothetical protein [Treponema sp.]
LWYDDLELGAWSLELGAWSLELGAWSLWAYSVFCPAAVEIIAILYPVPKIYASKLFRIFFTTKLKKSNK